MVGLSSTVPTMLMAGLSSTVPMLMVAAPEALVCRWLVSLALGVSTLTEWQISMTWLAVDRDTGMLPRPTTVGLLLAYIEGIRTASYHALILD